jgi:hypothetical protein
LGTLEETTLLKKLFAAVPRWFIQLITGLEQHCDLKAMTFEDAVGRLKTYDERIK